jgi:hypothetical protein
MPHDILAARPSTQDSDSAALTLSSPLGSIKVPLAHPDEIDGAAGAAVNGKGLTRVKVWEWSGLAWDEGDDVAAWLSDFLSDRVRCILDSLLPRGISQGLHPVESW